jgi:hypothetical protein
MLTFKRRHTGAGPVVICGFLLASCAAQAPKDDGDREGEPDVQRYRLTVNQAGTETGGVSSIPPGISCGGMTGGRSCSALFEKGTRVTLRVEGRSQTFQGWGGDCGGAGDSSPTCIITMNRDRAVSAIFGPNDRHR